MITTDDYPKPPSLHWGLVLLFNSLTFGIFGLVWILRQGAWVRRLDPTCNAVFILVVSIAIPLILIFVSDEPPMRVLRLLANVGSIMAFVWGYLLMRGVIEDKFMVNLNVVMTIVFNFLYLQYHMTRIAKGEYPLRGDVRY